MTAIPFAARARESTDSFVSAGKTIHVQRFDPARPQGRPAILLLHGSDGPTYRADLYRGIAGELAQDGYPALLVHYFDSTGPHRGRATDPLMVFCWLQALSDAVAHALTLPGASSQRVGLVGFSLGAYLGLALAAQDPRVGAVVEIAGGLHELVLAGLEQLPPVLILHGDRDGLVPVTEAHRLEQQLKKMGVPYEKKIYPDVGHTLSAEASADARRRAREFLEKHLRA